MNIAAKRSELAKLIVDAGALRAELEAKSSSERSADDITRLNNMITAGEAIRAEVMTWDRLAELEKYNAPEGSKSAEIDAQASAAPAARKSWGRSFVESEQYKREIKSGDPRQVAPVQVKALYEGTAANGGALVLSERRLEVTDNARQRPIALLDVLNVSRTVSDTIEYVALTAFTNNAAEVLEWDGSSNYGLKPESDMTFADRSAAVKTIAHWIRESRNILNDAPRLQNFIDTKLVQGLELRLEAQALNGNGTGANLLGILQTGGIQTRVQHATTFSGRGQTATTTTPDTIRMALTDISVAFYRPSAIIMHPFDAEGLELAKDSTGNYLNVYDSVAQRIWRTRVVETPVIAAKTVLVGDFAGATLYMREDASVRVSENVADDFIRNAVRVLAELRAALAVTDVSAFEKVTLA